MVQRCFGDLVADGRGHPASFRISYTLLIPRKVDGAAISMKLPVAAGRLPPHSSTSSVWWKHKRRGGAFPQATPASHSASALPHGTAVGILSKSYCSRRSCLPFGSPQALPLLNPPRQGQAAKPDGDRTSPATSGLPSGICRPHFRAVPRPHESHQNHRHAGPGSGAPTELRSPLRLIYRPATRSTRKVSLPCHCVKLRSQPAALVSARARVISLASPAIPAAT